MARFDQPLPVTLIPTGDLCVPLFIPNDAAYITAMVELLRGLTLDRYWQRDNANSALIVREQWTERMLVPFLDALATASECGEPHCVDFYSDDAIISYGPQNPFTEPNLVPSGYLTTPFTLFSNFGAIGWLSTWFPTFTEDLTVYQPNDIIVDISSLPLFANWSDLLSDLMPQISIGVTGTGTMELHLINFPLGGRAIITIDTQPNLADIFLGILGNAELSVELNRDIISLPIESPSVVIHEIEINTSGSHTVYITFVPVLDDALIPINFGGGLRKVVLCGFGVSPMAVEDIRLVDCNLEKFENGVWVEVADLSLCIASEIAPLETDIIQNATDITDNDSDIQELSDTSQDTNIYPPAPTSNEQDELCGAAWYIAEQLEALANDTLADTQTTVKTVWIDGLLAASGFVADVLGHFWDWADTNYTASLLTDISDNVATIAEHLYCNDLDKVAAQSAISSDNSIPLTVKDAYDRAINSVTDGKWSLWAFVGSLDLTRDCSAFVCGTWCHRFEFTLGLDGWTLNKGTQTALGIQTAFLASGGGTYNDANVTLDITGLNVTSARIVGNWVKGYLNNTSITWWISPLVTGTGEIKLTQSLGTTLDGQTRDDTIDVSDWSDIRIHMRSAARTSGQYTAVDPEAYIQFIELSGIGSNPFGTENCL